MKEISRRLGRSPSTISRELRRNMRRHDRGKYDAVLAHPRSREKARRHRAGVIGKDPALRDLVQEKLTEDGSPEQISFWLRETHPQKNVCHETIYQAVYWPGNSGLTRRLTKNLRAGDRFGSGAGDLMFALRDWNAR
jgi:IS30 family transposase